MTSLLRLARLAAAAAAWACFACALCSLVLWLRQPLSVRLGAGWFFACLALAAAEALRLTCASALTCECGAVAWRGPCPACRTCITHVRFTPPDGES